MRFIAIDCETTGLDPNKCQMVELAMVHVDITEKRCLVDSKQWHILPREGEYIGEEYALNMNAAIIGAIQDGTLRGVTEKEVVFDIQQWLSQLGYIREGFVPCGKNVMGFDMRFLRRLPGWGYPKIKHKHRGIDVGTLMLSPRDEVPPDLEECKRRAGVIGKVSHRAIDDTMDCVEIVKWWFAKNIKGAKTRIEVDLDYNPVAEQDVS